MLGVAKWFYLAALAVWMGSIVFFSFFVAPNVFRALPTEEAGRVIGTIFPNYYRLGYACGVLLLLTSVVLWRAATVSAAAWVATTALATVMLLLTLYAGLVVQPRAHALRPQLADPSATAAKAEFDALHRRAVQANAAVLIGGLIVTGLTAASLRP